MRNSEQKLFEKLLIADNNVDGLAKNLRSGKAQVAELNTTLLKASRALLRGMLEKLDAIIEDQKRQDGLQA